MSRSFAFCERCSAKLNLDKIWWLEYDQRTGTYTDKEVPAEFSQGGFPFGKDCAKKALAEHEAAQQITASDGTCTCGKSILGEIDADVPCPVAWHNPPRA